MPLQIIIAGAGTCGLCTACYLRASGHSVTLIERSKLDFDPDSPTSSLKQGWTTHFYANGTRPLLRLGLTLQDLDAVSLQSWWFRDWKNDVLLDDKTHFTEEYGSPSGTIRRGVLQRALHQIATEPPTDRVRRATSSFAAATWGPPVKVIDAVQIAQCDVQEAMVELSDGRIVHGDILLGCDGIRSAVRAALYQSVGKPAPQPETLGMAYFVGLLPTSYFVSEQGKAAGLEYLGQPTWAQEPQAGLAKWTCRTDPKRWHFVTIHMNAKDTLLIMVMPDDKWKERFAQTKSSVMPFVSVEEIREHIDQEYDRSLHGIFE